MSETRVARLDDLAAGQPKLVEVGGARVVLARVGETVYACDDMCIHSGGPLSEGKLSGTRLTCPWHGWSYDVRSGACLLPAHARERRIGVYPVRVEAGDVWVDVG